MVGLVFGLLVISGALFALGGLLATGGELTLRGSVLAVGQPAMLAAGGFFGLAGVVVLCAGAVGLVHKLIADSVTAGFENADSAVTSPAPVGVGDTSTESEPGATTTDDRDSPTTSDRAERTRDDPIAADSPTQKPDQSQPSTGHAADAAEDSVTDPGSEPAKSDDGGDVMDPATKSRTADDSTAGGNERPTPADIDRAVSEATKGGLGEQPVDVTTDETLDQADTVSTAEKRRRTEVDSTDDVFTEPEPVADTEPSETERTDVIDHALEREDEDGLDDSQTVVDEAIQEDDVEDTTDEPGDWEPLSGDDMRE